MVGGAYSFGDGQVIHGSSTETKMQEAGYTPQKIFGGFEEQWGYMTFWALQCMRSWRQTL